MDKLEKHIKQSLEKRRIQPSDTTWNKIESQLDDAKKSHWGFPKIGYAVAAVFLGALIVTTLFWRPEDPSNEIEVVNTAVEEVPDTKEKIESTVEEQPDSIEEAVEGLVQVDQSSVFKTVPHEEIVSVQPINEPKNDFQEQEQLLIDQKVNEVFAKVALLESGDDAITNAEVDSLLRNAQKEILSDKIFNENGTVDALALLNEVENELDQTFRDQIFEALKDGYTKLRTAVADRNN
ncbi:MAG: hypothetical protein ED555_01040 [Allomuricauda sp.]|nr:MAG: hypothetical protein ED555_01040 [Allomuricauda sp.]